jgi:hypothetical protein
MSHRLMGLLPCLGIILAGCDNPDPITKCKWFDETGNMVSLGLEINTEVPDRCPVKIATGNVLIQNYAGTVSGPAASVSFGNSLNVVFKDALNNFVQTYVSTFVGDGPHTAFVSTAYIAGNAGRMSAAASQKDYAFNTIQIDEAAPGPNYAIGRVELTYDYTLQASVGVPLTATTNAMVTVNAQLLAPYPGPLTYKWWVNNVLQSITSPSFQYTQGGSGAATFKVQVTDVEGDKGLATSTTTFNSPGGGGGGGGGGGPGCAPRPDRAQGCP